MPEDHGSQPEARGGFEDRNTAIQAWRDAKFGMFIHWGIYSIPAGVWEGDGSDDIGEDDAHTYAEHIQLKHQIPVSEYARVAERFNPRGFDADAWVDLARQAGMRHMVITAKHQDGFAMYDSTVSDYTVVAATPFARDPMRELAAAARRGGLGFGFYYSHARDHHHPTANWNAYGNTWDFPTADRAGFVRYLNEKAKPQIKELLTGYGELAVMWFDVPYEIPPEESREIADLVHRYQPRCLVNSRVGGDTWDYRSLGDNQIADSTLDEPWETCMTTNDSWGYHRLDENRKSAEHLIRSLVEIVGKGGYLLLNVGPTADGVIPKAAVDRLRRVGDWLNVNGESIYGTTPGGVQGSSWGCSTMKGTRIYLHVLEWPESGSVEAINSRPGASNARVQRARVLATGQQLEFTQTGEQIRVQLPATAPDPIDTVIVLEEPT